jgi:hypothetical protein
VLFNFEKSREVATMVALSTRLTERTAVHYTLTEELSLQHARWLRGAVAQRVNRSEFHHHCGDRLVFQHPLIRYCTRAKQAAILGLSEGAFLLRGLPTLTRLRLGNRDYEVVDRNIEAGRCEIGASADPILYRFVTPYLALNQDNYNRWQAVNQFAQRELLARIVLGNLLSLSKAIHLNVSERLRAEVDLHADGWHELKPGVRLLGFFGAIQVNYVLPEAWGIGKSSARGFGTVAREV